MEENLLDLLRNCPQLEFLFFAYDHAHTDFERTTDKAPTEAVPLPFLRSFTLDQLLT
jgi:hypothetical protein